jgi:hypothetical protein
VNPLITPPALDPQYVFLPLGQAGFVTFAQLSGKLSPLVRDSK